MVVGDCKRESIAAASSAQGGWGVFAQGAACGCARIGFYSAFPMISPETFNHIENIKKRAGHLWRFL
jgi:hypothetical protein